MKKRDAYLEMWNTAYLAGLEWVMWAVLKFTGTNEVVVGPLLGKMPLAKPMTPENTPGKAMGGGGGGGCLTPSLGSSMSHLSTWSPSQW